MKADSGRSEEPGLLDVGAVARALGMRPVTIWGWIRSGRLPAVRFGRTLRVRADVLAELIDAGLPPASKGTGC